MLCADPTRCSPRRPCRTSSRTRAIGSRADRPPPSATVAPSPTRDTASVRLTRLSRGGCRLIVILRPCLGGLYSATAGQLPLALIAAVSTGSYTGANGGA